MPFNTVCILSFENQETALKVIQELLTMETDQEIINQLLKENDRLNNGKM